MANCGRDRARLQLPAFRDKYIFGGLARRVAIRADLLDELQAFDHVPKDAREAAHLLQDDAELRADHPQVVVALLRAPHPDRAANGQQLRVVGQEERLLKHGPSAAAVVELEVPGYDALALPTLKDRAASVPHAGLTGGQNAEILRHLRRHVRPHFDHDAAQSRAVDFHVEVVQRAGIRWVPRHLRRVQHDPVGIRAFGR